MGLVIAVATIAGYGAIWWILGIRGAGYGSGPAYGAAILPVVLLLLAARRRMGEDSPERRRQRAQRGRIIGTITGLQAVLILVALKLLGDAGRLDLLAPVVAVVMGLHFLAFARLFPARIYYITSALLVALGVAGLPLPPGPPRVLVVSAGAACILWLTCAAVLVWPGSRRTGG